MLLPWIGDAYKVMAGVIKFRFSDAHLDQSQT